MHDPARLAEVKRMQALMHALSQKETTEWSIWCNHDDAQCQGGAHVSRSRDGTSGVCGSQIIMNFVPAQLKIL